jgi:hypothetical protein
MALSDKIGTDAPRYASGARGIASEDQAREVRHDERQELADWRSTREGFVAIKGRAERFAPTAASSRKPST